MVHQREGLTFGIESRNDLRTIHPRTHDLDGDAPPHGTGFLGLIDGAHASLAQEPEYAIRADAFRQRFRRPSHARPRFFGHLYHHLWIEVGGAPVYAQSGGAGSKGHSVVSAGFSILIQSTLLPSLRCTARHSIVSPLPTVADHGLTMIASCPSVTFEAEAPTSTMMAVGTCGDGTTASSCMACSRKRRPNMDRPIRECKARARQRAGRPLQTADCRRLRLDRDQPE